MNEHGVAVLYTADGRLMERLIKDHPQLRLREKRRTAAGGLSPWVFVIEKKNGHSGGEQ